MDRFNILIGRLRKMETYQSKMANFMNGVVFGGELPDHIKVGLKDPEIQAKLKSKIDKAERIKLQIAIQIYDDV